MPAKGRIPEEFIEELKRKNDIVSVVERYVTLTKKSGSNFFGLCPFHGEDTPSFSVSPAKQIFYCFGCHRGGDVIRFIMESEQLSYPEAIRFLAKQSGMEVPDIQEDPVAVQKRKHRVRLLDLYLEAARFYYRALVSPAGDRARTYCEQRGIPVSIQRKFGLGFAPDAWSGLLQHLKKKNLDSDVALLQESGLFRTGQSGGLYDLFRNRLMVPFFDATGQLIAFGGRSLQEGGPKYVNSPDTPLYTKGQHLYALNLARKTRKNHFLLVEGYLDAITCHAFGFDQTVAVLGTALTPAQARLLRRQGKEEVLLCFDSDSAGLNAVLRSFGVLKKEQVPARVVLLHGAKDPDAFLRQSGPEAFQTCLDRAMRELDFRIHLARVESKEKGESAAQFATRVLQLLKQEASMVEVEEHLRKLANEVQLSYSNLVRDFENLMQREPVSIPAAPLQVEEERSQKIVHSPQLRFLFLAMEQPELLLKLKRLPGSEIWTGVQYQQLYLEILSKAPEKLPYGDWEVMRMKLPDWSDSDWQELLSLGIQMDTLPVTQTILQKMADQLTLEWIANELNQIARQLALPDSDQDALLTKMKDLSARQSEIKQILEIMQ